MSKWIHVNTFILYLHMYTFTFYFVFILYLHMYTFTCVYEQVNSCKYIYFVFTYVYIHFLFCIYFVFTYVYIHLRIWASEFSYVYEDTYRIRGIRIGYVTYVYIHLLIYVYVSFSLSLSLSLSLSRSFSLYSIYVRTHMYMYAVFSGDLRWTLLTSHRWWMAVARFGIDRGICIQNVWHDFVTDMGWLRLVGSLKI